MLLYYCYKEVFKTKGESFDIFESPYGKDYLHVRESVRSLMAEVDKIPYEQVYTKSHDGLKLAARYYHTKAGAPLEILFHGYKSSGLCDFCGGTKLALRKGHNVLMIDQRGHGLSEGEYLTFGAFEKHDCLTWVNFAIDRFGEDIKIYLVGTSMGASTVLLAAGLNLPSNVAGIIADSPYVTAESIIKKVCKDRKLPPKVAYAFVKKAAKSYMKCDLNEANVLEATKNANLPILIIHGEADSFVPYKMSEEIVENSPQIKLVSFPGAGHVMSYVTDPERYEEVIDEFMKKAGIV